VNKKSQAYSLWIKSCIGDPPLPLDQVQPDHTHWPPPYYTNQRSVTLNRSSHKPFTLFEIHFLGRIDSSITSTASRAWRRWRFDVRLPKGLSILSEIQTPDPQNGDYIYDHPQYVNSTTSFQPYCHNVEANPITTFRSLPRGQYFICLGLYCGYLGLSACRSFREVML
jgi:hypothetical protein